MFRPDVKRLVSFARILGAVLVVLMTQGIATAQVRPAMVRDVDEPARVPYLVTVNANCPYVNACYANFPVIPAGKRLRITHIGVFSRFQSASGFLALDITSDSNPVLANPVSPINLAYYGNSLASSFAVDYFVEAGETPILELGTTGTWVTVFPIKLTITGYIVDVAP